MNYLKKAIMEQYDVRPSTAEKIIGIIDPIVSEIVKIDHESDPCDPDTDACKEFEPQD